MKQFEFDYNSFVDINDLITKLPKRDSIQKEVSNLIKAQELAKEKAYTERRNIVYANLRKIFKGVIESVDEILEKIDCASIIDLIQQKQFTVQYFLDYPKNTWINICENNKDVYCFMEFTAPLTHSERQECENDKLTQKKIELMKEHEISMETASYSCEFIEYCKGLDCACCDESGNFCSGREEIVTMLNEVVSVLFKKGYPATYEIKAIPSVVNPFPNDISFTIKFKIYSTDYIGDEDNEK